MGLVRADVADTDTVETVVAVAASVGVLGVTDLETREVGTDEAKPMLVKGTSQMNAVNILVPFLNLGEGVVVTRTTHRQVVREHETTKRVTTLSKIVRLVGLMGGVEATYEISTVGVKLTTEVIGCQVELGLVKEGNDFKVRGRLEELHAGDGTSRDETSATSGLGAPRDFLTLRVTDGSRAVWWGPDTPVLKTRQ